MGGASVDEYFSDSRRVCNKNGPPKASRFYFFLPDPNVGCQPAVLPFWLGAAAIVFIFSFFGFLDSRLPLAMSLGISLSKNKRRPARANG
jgi:hypothetical protein